MHRVPLRLPWLLLLGLSSCSQDEQRSAQQPTGDKPLELGIDTAQMDLSVRPQDDFFNYVNGTWLKNTEIPADKSRYGAFVILRDLSDERQRVIIEEVSDKAPDSLTREERQIGDLFASFMDVGQLDKLGIEPLAATLAEIRQLESKEAMTAYIARAYRDGTSGPVIFYVYVDFKNPTEYIVYLAQSGLGLPDRDYYFRDDEKSIDIRSKYVAFMQNVFTMAGFESSEAAASTVMEIETQLAAGHWTKVENREREKTYNKLTMAELQELSPTFDWSDYFTAIHVVAGDSVVVRQPSYLESFNKTYALTSLDDWKTYMAWQVLNTHLSYLGQEFDDANFDFYSRTLRGVEQKRERWQRAVHLVNRHIGEIVGKVYVARHFKPEAKARMEELVENLSFAFGEAIDELDWMGQETKKAAHAKLRKFTRKIGYPDKWEDYSTLEIRPNDLVGNFQRINQWQMQDNVEKLGQPIDRDEWGMTPQTVNAYYNSALNEIVFPAAILQPPFFNMDADDAVNYGAIGAVIGHEMGHGFDDQGRKTDGDGHLRDWWTEDDADAFKARAAKLVEQYSAYYPIEDTPINGELTLGENIGDLSGLAIAYRAYKISLNGREAPVIDGFNGDQRFFIGFAQVYRGKTREAAVRQQLLTDPHSPGQYRVLGVVANMPEFYQAFDVREGDKLYRKPEDRVRIW